MPSFSKDLACTCITSYSLNPVLLKDTCIVTISPIRIYFSTSVSLPYIPISLSMSTTAVVTVIVYYISGSQWSKTPSRNTLVCFPPHTIRVHPVTSFNHRMQCKWHCASSHPKPWEDLELLLLSLWEFWATKSEIGWLHWREAPSSQCPNLIQPQITHKLNEPPEWPSVRSTAELSSWTIKNCKKNKVLLC